MEMSQESRIIDGKPWVCNFGIRIFALIIDSLILGGVGFVLSSFFEQQFIQLGDLAWAVGALVSISYFSMFNSSLMGGQTLGKNATNIKVVDANNKTLSFPRSLARYCIFSIPYYLGSVTASSEMMLPIADTIVSFLVIAVFFGTVYLYIFNKVTRQTLHDVIVGSFVVNLNSAPAVAPTKVWKGHLIIIVTLASLLTVVPAFFSEEETVDRLTVTQEILDDFDVVSSSYVASGTRHFSSSETGSRTTTYVDVSVTLVEDDVLNDSIAQAIAQEVVFSYPESVEKDVLNVTLSYGYDIGIWSNWNSKTYRFNPKE
jgi:uncharacterized RDD family membrane protein YckC